MALSIKDPETDRLARRLAQLTGESITQAVHAAINDASSASSGGAARPSTMPGSTRSSGASPLSRWSTIARRTS